MEKIELNSKTYIAEDSIETQPSLPVYNYDGDEENIPASYIGKYVIVRSWNEGVNAGTVLAADNNGIVLGDCRRLWRHIPKNKSLSWYEGVAISGLDDNSSISAPVPQKVIVEKYSITSVSSEAEKSIKEFKSHEQD